jgi:putative tricarboxylic transport membrane protein
MSDQPNSGRDRAGGFIRAPQDFYGGLVLIGLAIFALYAGGDLSGMQGFSFGPGTAPRLFAGLLIAFGVGVTIMGVVFDGPPVERWSFRGVILTVAAILLFAVTVRPLGLIPSTYMAFLVSAAASSETRWIETAIAGAAMAAGCAILFPYILNLPFHLWPQF